MPRPPVRLVQVGCRVAPLGGGGTVKTAPALPAQATQHYALLPPSLRTPAPLVTRISDSLHSPGLNHLCHYLPYICLFPSSVPHSSVNCHMSLYYPVLKLFLSFSMSV